MNDHQISAASSLDISIGSVFQPESPAQIRDWLTHTQTSRQQKEDFLQALLDFEDDCGGFYRDRAFLLAAEYLALCPGCRQGDAIVDRLLKLSYAYFRVEKADWCMPPEALVRSARETLKRTDLGRVVPRFEAMIRQTESRQVMRYAANELLMIQPGNRCAIAAIAFDRLIPTKDQEYNYYHKPSPLEIKALRAIAKSPIASDEAAQAISQLLIDQSRTEDVLALKQLIQHSPDHPLVIYKLLNLTEDVYDYESDYDDEKIRLRPHVDQLWQELRQLNHNCVSNLIQIAEKGKYTAFTAIRVLAKLSPGCEFVAYAAIDLLFRN
jgi:hypothetical protein